MTRNRRLFTSYKGYDDGHVIFGSKLKGKDIGGSTVTHDSITVTNVEHVSGLAFNLISIGQLCDDDCVVSFTKIDCTISKNGKTLAKGHSLPELKSSPLVKDDRISEPIVQDLNGSPSLQVNVLDEGYPKSIKEARCHPIEQVIGELNERTLRSWTKQV
ncbi:hypothetical protein Tco_1014965 [Tanacetum coccineum]